MNRQPQSGTGESPSSGSDFVLTRSPGFWGIMRDAVLFGLVLGFAALSVSKVRPIREMGLWTALGLTISWVVAFTLLPALQLALRTPTGTLRVARDGLYERFAARLPTFTFRHRRGLVVTVLLLCVAGAAALFGIPRQLSAMPVGIDTLTYIDPSLPLHRDLAWFRKNVADLNVASILSWARPARIDMSPFPKVAEWLKICAERPAARAARQLQRE